MPQSPQQYDTPLSPPEEKQFQTWKQQYAPKDSGYDYDLRGAFKAGLKPDAETGHWPDTFKKPNHPTFSNESKYAKDRPDLAGHWEGTGKDARYVPPRKNMADGPIPDSPDTQNLPVGTRAPMPGPQPSGDVAQPAPTPPQPSPQQADLVRHAALGKVVKAVMGTQTSYKVNPVTGETEETNVPQTPGQWGRSMVLGAMLGLAGAADHKAQGGSVGGFMGGFGLGGTAVADHGEQQDLQKRQQAQQQFKNQQAAEQNKREQSKEERDQQAFKTEQDLRTIQITGANMALVEAQQRIAKGDLEHIQASVEMEKTMVGPYEALGVTPIAKDQTKDEVNTILKNNPKAMGWQAFNTGWKPVMTKSGEDWVPTFSIYDTNMRVPLTKDFIDQMEKNGVDKLAPGTTKRLRAMQQNGKEFKAEDMAALNTLNRKAYTESFGKEKDATDLKKEQAYIRDLDAQGRERDARAAAEGKKDKAEQAYGKGMKEWQAAINDAREDNPEISDAEVFASLDKDTQGAITSGLAKQLQDVQKDIDQDLNPLTYDAEAAKAAMAVKAQYRRYQSQVLGVAKKAPATQDLKMPIAKTKGEHPSQDMVDSFVAKYNTPEETKAAMIANGWDPSSIAEEAKPGLLDNVKRGSEAVSGAAKKFLGKTGGAL